MEPSVCGPGYESTQMILAPNKPSRSQPLVGVKDNSIPR